MRMCRASFVLVNVIVVSVILCHCSALVFLNNRRNVLQDIMSVTLMMPMNTRNQYIIGKKETSTSDQFLDEQVTVPLKWIPELQAYVVFYTVGGDKFGAILDTGSPFLTVPSYCDETKWGCYRESSSIPSGYEPTMEQYDNNAGEVNWRSAPFAFLNATGSMMGPKSMVFGVLAESLMDGPGGVFMGLVKYTDSWIRPSFLGQTNVKAFSIDLANPEQKSFTLSTQSLLPTNNNDYIPLVNDLNRRYGDPTIHYTARAQSITVNGFPLVSGKKKPIYVIIDTGVTGMSVSQELYDERYIMARRNKERSLWDNVEVTFQSKGGDMITLKSQRKPITTPIGEIPWKGFNNNAHLVVLGLSFLDGNVMTFDIDDGKFWIETPSINTQTIPP